MTKRHEHIVPAYLRTLARIADQNWNLASVSMNPAGAVVAINGGSKALAEAADEIDRLRDLLNKTTAQKNTLARRLRRKSDDT